VDTTFFDSTRVVHLEVMTRYLDIKSNVLLAENGKGSSSRQTQHLDVRYFFVTDKIKKGEVGGLLPNTQHARVFLYKAPTRKLVCANVR